MNGNNNDKVSIDWGGARGAIWTLAGAAIATVAQRGGLGGFLGGNPPPLEPPATQRDLTYERELTKANAEIGQLKAEKYADTAVLASERRFEDKLDAIEAQINAMNATQGVLNAKQQAFIEGLAGQVAAFDRMTARYINGPIMVGSEAIASAFKSSASSSVAAAA